MDTLNNQERPTSRKAGRAFLRSEAWQSGLSHRAYLPADLWASKPLAGSRQFESDRFLQFSGTALVAAAAAPINHPGDEPEANDHLSNIRLAGRFCQSRAGSFLHSMKDELHERSQPRPTNRDHRRSH